MRKNERGKAVVHKNFEDMLNMVTVGEKKTVAVACAHDAHALEAVLEAHKQGLVDYRLVGKVARILELGKELGYEIEAGCTVEADDDVDAAQKAVALIRDKSADFLMKGKLETATMMRAVLDKERGIRTDSTMSHLAILELPSYHKLIAVTDGGMIPYPTFEQKKMILQNAVAFFRGMGYESPKVACLAAVETVTPKMPETEDAKALKDLALAGAFGSCVVEGPISYDLTMSKESAGIKGFDSPVTEDADILLVPMIAAGNMLSKCMTYSAGAKMAGCILGAQVPIVLTSRGATAEEKHLSLLMAAASASKR